MHEMTVLDSTLADRWLPQGQITVRASSSDLVTTLPKYSVQTYFWTPHPDVRELFPIGYQFEMTCITEPAGFRRFLPTDAGVRTLLLVASLGGMAVLTRNWKLRDTDPEERQQELKDYRFRTFTYQWSFSRKRSLQREIRTIGDLSLKPNERHDTLATTILPEWLVAPVEDERLDQTHARALRDFLAAGRSEAEQQGKRKLTELELIRCSILAAARKDPLKIQGQTAEAARRRGKLIRESLVLDLGHDTALKTKSMEQIKDRLLSAYHKHDDCDLPKFRKWLFENTDGLVQSIVQRKGGSVELDRKQVHHGFADLIWESIGAISLLARLQLQQFQRDLPMPLSSEELTVFNTLYDEHDWSGTLLPLMFHSHFDLLKPLMQELQQGDSSDESRAAFVNATFLKTWMLKARRDGDALRKKSIRSDQVAYEQDEWGEFRGDKDRPPDDL